MSLHRGAPVAIQKASCREAIIVMSAAERGNRERGGAPDLCRSAQRDHGGSNRAQSRAKPDTNPYDKPSTMTASARQTTPLRAAEETAAGPWDSRK